MHRLILSPFGISAIAQSGVWMPGTKERTTNLSFPAWLKTLSVMSQSKVLGPVCTSFQFRRIIRPETAGLLAACGARAPQSLGTVHCPYWLSAMIPRGVGLACVAPATGLATTPRGAALACAAETAGL